MLPNQENIADILQSCLEMFQHEQGTISELLEQYPDYRDDLRPELEAARWLWKQSQVFDPRPGFVPASQDRLIRRIREGKVTDIPLVHDSAQVDILSWLASLFGQTRFAFRFVLAIILVISLFVGTSGVALASQDALPGELLYSVKLAVEDLSLAFTLPVAGDARLHIKFAERRLVEMQALLLEERYEDIGPVAAAYEEQIRLALRDIDQVATTDPPAAMQIAGLLEEALSMHSETVASLAAGAPPQAQPDLQRVILVSEQGEQAARQILAPAPIPPPPALTGQPTNSATPQPVLSTASGFSTAGPVVTSSSNATPAPTGSPTVPTTQPAPVKIPPTPAFTATVPAVISTPAPTAWSTEPPDSGTPRSRVTVKPPNDQKATAQAKKTARPQTTKKPKPTKAPKDALLP